MAGAVFLFGFLGTPNYSILGRPGGEGSITIMSLVWRTTPATCGPIFFKFPTYFHYNYDYSFTVLFITISFVVTSLL
jgi:hypothetical protein